MMDFALVALGGALGAVARYAISLLPFKADFPLWTLLINVIGAVGIGFVAGLATIGTIQQKQMLFWQVGLCGGFTTFSTFSLEAWRLLLNGKLFLCSIYVLLSIVLCILGVVAGQYLAKSLG